MNPFKKGFHQKRDNRKHLGAPIVPFFIYLEFLFEEIFYIWQSLL